VFAVDQHAQLCRALGIPEQAAGYGCEYVEHGEVPEGLDAVVRIEDGSRVQDEPSIPRPAAAKGRGAGPGAGAPPQFQITMAIDHALERERQHGGAYPSPFVPTLGMLLANAGTLVDDLVRRLDESEDEVELRLAITVLRTCPIQREQIDAAFARLRERLPADSPLRAELDA
jgi:hypothetical protein